MNKRKLKDLLTIADLALKQIELDIYNNKSLELNKCEDIEQIVYRCRNHFDEIRDLAGVRK